MLCPRLSNTQNPSLTVFNVSREGGGFLSVWVIAAERLRLKISGCNLLTIVMPLTKMKKMETYMQEN
ncbi:hypothetical protein C0J52_26780 [Blattella germanica]|nr:hypothetical protein C0J52_26780 [Blattella germanica]